MTRAELRYALSARIVEHIAAAEGMTVTEYGEVYDSEAHERLLIDLMELVDRAKFLTD